MIEILDFLRSSLAGVGADGNHAEFKLQEIAGAQVLFVALAGGINPRAVATIQKSGGAYIVKDTRREESHVEVGNEAVLSRVRKLTPPYSNVCWRCRSRVSMTMENCCVKCRRYVVCKCGVCLCDHPDRRIPPALTSEKIKELDMMFSRASIDRST
jgi:hypothetical protein